MSLPVGCKMYEESRYRQEDNLFKNLLVTSMYIMRNVGLYAALFSVCG